MFNGHLGHWVNVQRRRFDWSVVGGTSEERLGLHQASPNFGETLLQLLRVLRVLVTHLGAQGVVESVGHPAFDTGDLVGQRL